MLWLKPGKLYFINPGFKAGVIQKPSLPGFSQRNECKQFLKAV